MKKKIIYMLLLFMVMPMCIYAKTVSCGNITDIPAKFPEITKYIVTVLQVSVPIILVVLGSMDFLKAVSAQKEDEIKKGQSIFIKRLITAILVFLIVAITKLVVSAVSDSTDITDCIDCFISNKCKE